MASPNRPETQIDLSDAGIWHKAVPHEEFARLRKEAPIAWNERHDGHKGFWAATRYDDIFEISRNTDVFSSRYGVISLDDFDEDQNEARRTLLEMDPPQHTKMRKITSLAFSAKAAANLEDRVRKKVIELLDNVVGAGELDLVASLNKKLPISTLCLLLGVPDERQDDMIRWSDLLIGSDDPDFKDPAFDGFSAEEARMLPFGHPASLDAFELGLELAEARRKDPRDDIITTLATAEVDGRPLTKDEYCNYFLMLVVAGNETTRHTISHGLTALANFPEEWTRFCNEGIDSVLITNEILRWASPVHFVRRVATSDISLSGADIKKGDKVAMYYPSGNRDETKFNDPQKFLIDRDETPHMAFGKGGPHFCLGNQMAKLQIRLLLEEMQKRGVKKVELASPPDRLRSNHIHGIKALNARII